MDNGRPSQPPPVRRAVRQGELPPVKGAGIAAFAAFAVMAALIVLPLFVWFGCRIEPRTDQFAVLIRKTGENLPSGEIVALRPEQKGIRLDVLPEGRYFRNPYTWGWQIRSVLDIPAGKLGLQTRLFGADLAPGEIIAREGTKGIMAEVLRPGKYRVNPYAFRVELFDAISIRPGHVGVVTSLVGADPLDDSMQADRRNTFLVEKGMKGVLPEVLDPGTYYLNPYMVNVVELNLQSQRFEMSGADVINFLTMEGFAVNVEGTLEFALSRDKAALLTHRVGDMDDVIKKVILPRARGFSRIEGSKHPAVDLIVGETRQKFQSDLENHLREKCEDWGVNIKSVLIRKINVPDQIASINRDREVAVQNARKFELQIAQAKSKAELVKQEMLAQQNKEKVQADTARIRAVIAANQELEVQSIAANRDLEVARLEKDAAMFQADSIRLKAGGERDAVKAANEAEAAVIAAQAQAMGGGMNMARYTFYQKVAPKVRSVLSGDQRGGLGEILTPFLPQVQGKEAPR